MFETLENFQRWLEQSVNYEKMTDRAHFSLDSMRRLTEKFINPQNAFQSVHVAGSKGKGSVSQFIAAILHETGVAEGLYASPHVLDFSERVRTAYGFFDESVYARSAGEITGRCVPEEATWFEMVTLFAFLCFKNAGAAWGVFETGLGGRLDATNVLLPRLCIITPIELEHTEILGDTIEKIAAEKAGIFKPGVPVCISPQKKAARAVFERKARELDCPLYFLDDVLQSAECSLSEKGSAVRLDFGDFSAAGKRLFRRPLEARLQMFGAVQAQNAALAALACKLLFPDLEESVLEKALEASKLAGRFDIVPYVYEKSASIRIILDGAHTVNSIGQTLETLPQACPDKKKHALFACAADKKTAEIAPLFFSAAVPFSRLTLTLPGSFKKGDLPSLKEVFSSAANKHTCLIEADADFKRAIKTAIRNAALDGADLLITGSFYLVGEAYKIIRGQA